MIFRPYDQATPDPSGTPAWGSASGTPGWAPGPLPAPAKKSRKGLVVGATVAGVLVLGGAGAAVAAFLSGGGTQPEDVLPVDTFAFAKVDLDPSADQKLELMSLLSRFPDVEIEGSDDLRGDLLEPLLGELSGAQLDYASDIQPWLGNRLAVGAVAADDVEGGVATVIALAVDDEALMDAALGDAQAGSDMGYAVRDGYVLITQGQARADGFAAAERTLADDAAFSGDREALGGDQVALAWADLSEVEGVLVEQAAAAGVPADMAGDSLSGRLILGAHAQDDALEMAGLTFSVSDAGVPSTEPTRLMSGLPANTLVAVSASEIGERAVEYWDQLEQTGAFEGGVDPFAELGLQLPDDLRTIFGTDLVVAFFGDAEAPSFGVRVVTDDGRRAAQLVNEVLSDPEFGVATRSAPVPDGYAFGSDDASAQAVSADDGSLVASEAYQAAVADQENANGIGYVNLGEVIDQVVAQGGPDAEEAARFAAIEAAGFSMTGTDEGTRFVLRITTR